MVLVATKHDCSGFYSQCTPHCKPSVSSQVIARFSSKTRLVSSESWLLEVMDMFMINCGDSFMDVYLSSNSSSCRH